MHEVLALETQGYIEQQTHVLRSGLPHEVFDEWPVDGEVSAECSASFRSADEYTALLARDGGVARVGVHGGIARVNAYASSPELAQRVLDLVRDEIPRADDSDPDLVPVTFWTYSVHGPESVRRMIDAPAWSEIERNYPAPGELAGLIGDWAPGAGGQLLLWHGDAGTGKTTALRSLGREWREWAELHYIVDPDMFFGESASYMISVMMGGEEVVKVGARSRWRVLILEDCAEMLAPDARREVGQALSRLLNACDGLIGRGLRLLILITTNEPLEKVHPAISRPGRCAARIEFERFGAEQAANWLGLGTPIDRGAGALTLADLYAISEGHRSQNGRRAVGFAAA